MLYHILVGIILLFAAFTLGTAGFGFAMISVPLLSLTLSPHFVVPFVLIYAYGINFFLFFQLRKHIDWSKLWPLTVGVLPGTFLGIHMLKHTEDVVMRKTVGIVVVVFVLWILFSKGRKEPDVSRLWALATGFAGGVLSGALAMPAPPVLMYLTFTRWDKNLTRATLQTFFIVTGTCTLIGFAMKDVLTLQVLRSNLLYLPFVAAGGVGGYALFTRINSGLFHKLLRFLLLAIGALLLLS